MPGLAALNTARLAGLDALSRGAPGNCGAGGSYSVSAVSQQAYVVNQR